MATFDVDVLVHLNIRTRVTGTTEEEAAETAISNVTALLNDLDLAHHIAGYPEAAGLQPAPATD